MKRYFLLQFLVCQYFILGHQNFPFKSVWDLEIKLGIKSKEKNILFYTFHEDFCFSGTIINQLIAIHSKQNKHRWFYSWSQFRIRDLGAVWICKFSSLITLFSSLITQNWWVPWRGSLFGCVFKFCFHYSILWFFSNKLAKLKTTFGYFWVMETEL